MLVATGLAQPESRGQGSTAWTLRPRSMASLPAGVNPQSHSQFNGFLRLFHGTLGSVGCGPPSSSDGGLAWAAGTRWASF